MRQGRDATDLTWGKMSMKDWANDYKQAINAAIAAKPEKYRGIKMQDIYAVMSNPKGALFKSYQRANPGISSQASRYDPDDDMGLVSLTSRAPVNWKEAAVPGTPPTQNNDDDPIEED